MFRLKKSGEPKALDSPLSAAVLCEKFARLSDRRGRADAVAVRIGRERLVVRSAALR